MPGRFHRWRQFLFRGRGPHVASLFLAGVTWYAIQAVISFEKDVSDVPLSIRTEEGWAVLDRSARTVDILFRGPQEDIRYLDREQVKVEVDVHAQPSSEGAVKVKLRPKDVRAPGAVRALVIRPEEVTFRMDREEEKQVPVKADLQGVPPEGYEVERVLVTPASVLVKGPRQRLDEIEAVRTVPIDLEGRSRTFKKLKLPLSTPSETWLARVVPSNVVVEVTMVERSASKDLSEVPVRILVPPGQRPRLDVWPSAVNVVLKGRAELLKNLDREDIQAYVDCAGLEGGSTYDLPVRVQTPSGLSAQSVEPPTVKVTAM